MILEFYTWGCFYLINPGESLMRNIINIHVDSSSTSTFMLIRLSEEISIFIFICQKWRRGILLELKEMG
jgi:hypothetical protein